MLLGWWWLRKEGKIRQEDLGIIYFVGHVICTVISKFTVPVWVRTEEGGYLRASAVFSLGAAWGLWLCKDLSTRGWRGREQLQGKY
jgi:hypothetical protein